MAKYTMTVYDLKMRGFDFGLKNYPIFDENYRDTLNNLILNNFMIYEIGFETPMMFKYYLNTKMETIMPYYNEMYKAQLQLLSNPYDNNIDITETFGRNVANSANSNSSSSGRNKNLYQDTPQGELSSTDIENQRWATNLTLNQNNINDNTSSNGTTVEDYTKHILGNNGKKYKVELYNTFIKNIKNINQEIINELTDLFMGVL